jgi:site-specific recombinase XerD
MYITEAYEAYRTAVIVFQNQSVKTEDNLISSLRSLISFTGEDILVSALTFETVRSWKLWLDKKCSIGTTREYLGKLRVVLSHLERLGVDSLKADLIHLPKRENKPIDFLTKEEVSELIRVAGAKQRGYSAINRARNQAMISMLYGSGIRIGEMCKLDRDSIYQRTFTAYGKGNKSRIAFIDERTEKLLEEYLLLRKDSNSALFLATQSQKRLNPSGAQFLLRELGQKAKFTKPIHPHIFRHSFATNLLFSNTNMRHVQTLLGHSSLETTQLYAHVVNEDLKAIYDAKHQV